MKNLDYYLKLGLSYDSQFEYKNSLKQYKKALAIAKTTRDKEGELVTHFNLGSANYSLDRYHDAINQYKKALAISKKIGNKEGEANCYINIGLAFDSMTAFNKSIAYQEKALAIAKKNKNGHMASRCYINIGLAFDSMAEFNNAINQYKKALAISKKIGNKEGENRCYINLGAVYHSLDRYHDAINQYKKALAISKKIGNKEGEANCYINIGVAYRSLTQYEVALDYQEKALLIFKQIGDKEGEANCYINIGLAFDSMAEFNNAINQYKKALAITKKIGDQKSEINCYINIGLAHYSLLQHNNSIRNYEKALAISKKIGDKEGENIARFNLALTYVKNQPNKAHSYLDKSIEIWEQITEKITEQENKINVFSIGLNAYELMVLLCIKLRKKRKSFEYVERNKSQAFHSLMANVDREWIVSLPSKLQPLPKKMNVLTELIRNTQTQKITRMKNKIESEDIEKIKEELDDIYDVLEKYDPQYIAAKRGKSLTVKKIQELLENNSVLVEYFVTAEKTFIFVITKKSLKIKEVNLSRTALESYYEVFRNEVILYHKYQRNTERWAKIENYLIKPIARYLNGADLIYFVPHKILHSFPLHALSIKGCEIIRNHPVVYLPSASFLQFYKDSASKSLRTCATFAITGNSNELFEKEAQVVANYYGGTPIVNPSKKKVFQNLDKDILHFATHGEFQVDNPLSSYLLLKNDTLTAQEMFTKKINSSLVTLSACETGMSRIHPGDELIGLPRSFLYAGASSVMVSLWKVEDHSTHDLMKEFYANLKKLDKARAMQRAVIKTMTDERFQHPYFWAPFLIVGNWK